MKKPEAFQVAAAASLAFCENKELLNAEESLKKLVKDVSEALIKSRPKRLPKDKLLSPWRLENKKIDLEIQFISDIFRQWMLESEDKESIQQQLKEAMNRLDLVGEHYQSLQQKYFPRLKKKKSFTGFIELIEALQNETLEEYQNLKRKQLTEAELSRSVGKVLDRISELLFWEEYLIFPLRYSLFA